MANSIPRINFAGIDPAAAAGPGGDSSRWAAVRAVVMDALTEHGVFEAVMDGLISPELSAAMLGLGGATESFFSLPPSTKALYANKEKPYLGYVSSSFLTLPYGTLCVKDPPPPFPTPSPPWTASCGSPSFCETVQAYTEKVSALATVVLRMVLESLGATAESIEEQVLTNGRVVSPLHRVVVAGDKTRYACILFSNPRDDAVVRAVDAQRPAMYRPFQYSDYNGFFFSKEHNENPNKLEIVARRRG
ncbi:unnamed protein product [Urochloa decumbens]|uniref:Isopenicillin N synthase-like Fe(2+) 2OG dioxygenase domain-containing protein n=1 Tax=Urochloa decumbens TaxID=240449 RepID=A0ABC8VYS2_9POAL